MMFPPPCFFIFYEQERRCWNYKYGCSEYAVDIVRHALMRTYLPDMEVRTLVGKELWDFLSGDSNFHSRLFDDLRAAALAILGNKSIQEEINAKVHELLAVFEQRYGSGEEGVSNYINSIF